MAILVSMPQLGESVIEGIVVRWLKREGDPIARDEPLVEIMTDKVNVELPTSAAGILQTIRAAEGQTVAVGAPLAEIAPAGSDSAVSAALPAPVVAHPVAPTTAIATGAPAPAPLAGAPSPAPPERHNGTVAPVITPPVATTPPPGRMLARRRSSPLVRRLAREHAIALDEITGSGLGGRVTKRDLLAHLDHLPESRTAPISPAATRPLPPERPADQPTATRPTEERWALTPRRRAIAEHMLRSVSTAPHVTTVHEADLTDFVRWRARSGAAFRERHGVELGLSVLLIEAVCASLREVPVLNATWAGDAILIKHELNIGLAVALDDGVVVPVLHRADELSRLGLARAVTDRIARARANQLQPADMQGGTFTVNNVGPLGSLLSTPIINQPQAAILSAHKITRRVVVQADDSLAVRSLMYLALSFDHRIADGLLACRFVEAVCRRLERVALPELESSAGTREEMA